MTVSYTNSDATSRMLKVLSSGLRRMTDSELEITAIKLQEYFALRLGTADHRLWNFSGGSYTIAPYGAVIMSSLNRGTDTATQAFRVYDTRRNATVSSRANNAWDNYGDDDDTFDDPPEISTTYSTPFYLAQKHFANYGSSIPGFDGKVLQTGGDYYNLIKNWNGTSDLSSTVTNKLGGNQPADMIREFGHLNAKTDGTVHVEKDVQKIYEAIFKYVNARIRSTNNTTSFGQYRISTSSPGAGYFVVREQNGAYGAYWYYAFIDTVTSVNSVSYYNNLSAGSNLFTYALYLNTPTTTYGSGYKYTTDGNGDDSSVRPTRLSRWKITVHSGSGLEVTNSGDVREFFATGTYNGHGKYFYFKPATTNGGSVYVSSNYSSSSPSASSFESSARLTSLSYGESGFSDPSLSHRVLLAPSGDSNDGEIYLYNNMKYREYTSYDTNTIYKCERIDRLVEMDLPYIADWDTRYDWQTYIGHPDTSHDLSRARRRDHYNRDYIIHLLYNLYTLGRYYPVYSLSTSAPSGSQFNHGSFVDSNKLDMPGSLGVYGPTLYGSNSDTTGTYYKVRGAGASSTYSTTTYYLISEEG